MKIVSIIGARPQFIKAAVVSKEFIKRDGIEEILVHTGQHYDENMSKVFFDELEIPKPDYNLGVGSASHAVQTGQMLIKTEELLMSEKPDWVLVYGDTNSTIAGALAATKLHIKIAHVEAGLRSFNKLMPEEINRITTDRISDLLLVPSQNAMKLLEKEGLAENSLFVGDVMFDSILFYQKMAEEKISLSDITDKKDFYLATVHRAENTDDRQRLQNIFSAFSEMNKPVILPLHPRTRSKLEGIEYNDNVKIIEPVSYLEMILLLKNSSKVLTDSGGLQKEAYFMQKPCITLRDETEWIETLNGNWNFIVGTDKDLILEKISVDTFDEQGEYYGDGKAGEKIVNALLNY
ncbi:UDP-2,3-diacetamido-2,3-dideoxy-D-glucuronic acid 2-epimerase [hydrothermal vent metagenome]|uniref:UDP-2,3-diacetamido-2,3-dideoxy-D-glucuronic acid 2-epimerase n=1 Tax=hydrothermal vent metagenome TaxID=652676 RepID=A0A3B1BX46_9ZZZZ